MTAPRCRYARCSESRRTVKARRGEDSHAHQVDPAWVSNGTIATHALTFLSLDPSYGMAGGGDAVVPLDLPGITRGKPLDKMGRRALNQGEIFFDDVRLPARFMPTGLDRSHRAVVHVGVRRRASAGAGGRPFEAHLLDFEGDLYGCELVVQLAHEVADEVCVGSLDALARKIADDVAAVRRYFADVAAGREVPCPT